MKKYLFPCFVCAFMFVVAVACSKKNDDTPAVVVAEAADKFVGSYKGQYAESVSGSAFTMDNVSTTISKKTATDVSVSINVLGNVFTLAGVAKSDSIFTIPAQKFNGNDIISGTGTLSNKTALSLRYLSKATSARDTTRSFFDGTK